MAKIEGQVPRKGMNRSSHPSEIGEQEYTFALNSNIQSEQTGGRMIIQNESSNTLCSRFKDGYVVLKAKYDRVREVTYFFLLNETTGCSEIGKVDANKSIEPNQAISKMCGCDPVVILEEGLENAINIEAHCEYETILTDCCDTGSNTGSKCLAFSKNNPMKDVVIRHSTWGDELYFTDSINPPRFVRLDYIDSYKLDKNLCTGEETTYCLDCDKLRLFPLYEFPCLNPDVIQNGGNLPEGVYENFFFHCDSRGEISTHAIASTNPISIFNANNRIKDQTSLDASTDLAYSIDVNFIDETYDYYKVVIAYSSGNNPAPQYYDYGVFGTEENRIVVTNLPNDKNPVSEFDILTEKTTYKTAEGMEEVNGYLFQHGLTKQREINLQPVVNLMGTFAEWMSYRATEDLFKNGINSAKYKGRMRDESYPEALQFELKGGHRTALFPMISRPATQEDLEEYVTESGEVIKGGKNVGSINKNTPDCANTGRRFKWQFENTATVDEVLCSEGSDTEEVPYDKEVECESEPFIVTEGYIAEETDNIIEWINNNTEGILNGTYDYPNIKEALEHEYTDCTPETGLNCGEPTLIDSSIEAIGASGYEINEISESCNEYPKTPPPVSCNPLKEGETPERDTPVEQAVSDVAIVYKKEPITNINCGTAIDATVFKNGAEDDGYHLVDMSSVGTKVPLVTDIDISCCTKDDSRFSAKLHKNAAWFKSDFLTYDDITIEITNSACGYEDDNTDNTVRVAVWNSCPTTSATEQVSYCRCIDLKNSDCEDRFITLNKSDFPNGIAYISIDSPMNESMVVKFDPRVTGNGNISIGGELYPVTGSTVEELVQNFVATNQANLIAEGMYVKPEASDTYFTIRMTEAQFNSTSVIPTGVSELSITISVLNIFYRLSPPCGCFSVVKRETKKKTVMSYYDLEFKKVDKYRVSCVKTIPKISGSCDPQPFEHGKFSYVESSFKYPCNDELYDSSTLDINVTDIPQSIRTEFENVFTDGVIEGKYVLNSETNFTDKPIRHFKYPDNKISPFMFESSNETLTKGQTSYINPIGIHLNNEVINAFLDIAVKNNLLTTEEREQIVGYEIFRGDRRTQRSIIARGVSSNMMSYDDINQNKILYPNFPFNTRGKDIINQIGISTSQNFTFMSPDTLFNKPTLPQEVTIDGYMTGGVNTTFAPMLDHPTFTLLGQKARKLASTLAAAEVALEIALQLSQVILDTSASGGGFSDPIKYAAAIAAGITMAIQIPKFVMNAGKYRYQWLQTFEGIGQGYNFAYIALGECDYNNFIVNNQADSQYRGLDLVTYLDTGDVTVRDEKGKAAYKVNNYNREESVMYKFGEGYDMSYMPNYNGFENSVAQIGFEQAGEFSIEKYNGKDMRSLMPFMTLKQYLPGQWGSINSIPWLPTNSCNKLSEDNSCTAVFGGDIFISRFHVKRKFPIFRKTAHGLPPDTPYKYSRYLNVNNKNWIDGFTKSVGFIDYKTHNSDFTQSLIFPETKSAYTLFSKYGVTETTLGLAAALGNTGVNSFYVTDAWKFLVEYYSIPSFLVESEINCNYRHGRVGTESPLSDDFAPNVINTIDWVQQTNVPISSKEKFLYNRVYSKANYKKTYTKLGTDFNREEEDKKNDLENSVIFSHKDDDTSSLRFPWRQYKPNDTHKFSKGNGKLIDINGLESNAVLFRFTDGYTILGATDPIRDRLSPEQEALGIGHIFAEKALNFNKTELGHAGTQNSEFLSTPFGHYYPDAKRGKVIELAPNAQGMTDISVTMDKWFADQLPFKILKYFPEADIDNNYNGIGIAMGYDSTFSRILLTKKDYIPKVEGIIYEDGEFRKGRDQCPIGYEYEKSSGKCVKEVVSQKVPFGESIEVAPAGNNSHGFRGPALYSQYNSDGTANVDAGSPTGYTFQVLSNPWWTGNSVVSERYVNKLAKWTPSAQINTWYGGSEIVNIPENKIYYVALAADDIFRFSVDGVVVVEADSAAMNPQHNRTSGATFICAHIYPIVLEKGCRLITIEGLNRGGAGLFAASILDNTVTEIINSTSQSDLNEIYSTQNTTELYAEGFTQRCPIGSVSTGSGICSPCITREEKAVKKEIISLNDERYFEDVGWTVGYSPLTKSWISYYSYKPNYYVNYNHYFQTGINNLNNKEHGLWSHFPFISSYQVFYGKLHPFIIEYAKSTKGSKGMIKDVNFWLDVRKYTNKYDFSDVYGTGFNKAYIYNDFQNTGLLELAFQNTNDRSQIFKYPKYNKDSVEILQSEIEGSWSFNHLYNAIRNERSGLPVWLNDKTDILKEINKPLLDYSARRKDRVRGDYFLVRLEQDKESRFKMMFKSASENIEYYR